MTQAKPAIRPERDEQRGATVAQLSADINEGLTGDKIAAHDHAAAPLGTDEEAAGTPLPNSIVAGARAYERNRNAPKKAISPGVIGLWWFAGMLALAAVVMVAIVNVVLHLD